MRHIKMRAWDKKEKRMYHNVGLINNTVYYQEDTDYDIDDYLAPINTRNIDDVILMINTDSSDSLGNDIFDRDIIEFEKHVTNRVTENIQIIKVKGEIEYSNGSFLVYEDINKDPVSLSSIIENNKSNIKVIGNNLEDAHLLLNNKVEKDKIDKDNTEKSEEKPTHSNTTQSNNDINQVDASPRTDLTTNSPFNNLFASRLIENYNSLNEDDFDILDSIFDEWDDIIDW